MLDKVVFASTNQGKIREIKQLFAGLNIEIIPVSTGFEPVENGETFLDNAIIKAQEAVKLTNTISLADDSGLIVDALGGRPGVHSSRYAEGDQNRITKLLDEMKDVPEGRRQARFVCSMALVGPDKEVLHATTGTCEGKIIFEPRGQDGFGFDPVFFIPEKNLTMAQVPLEEKNTISHRARALAKMLEWIRENKVGN